MSHFFTFTTNENGIFSDGYLDDEISKAMSARFGLGSVFIYSHGWWNDASAASNCYNRFSIGLANTVIASGGLLTPSLNVGIHWPSTVSENSGSIEQFLQPTSFFTMETRADDIGETGVNGLMISILRQWKSQERNGPLTINLLGHSFGCKVVCAAIQKLSAVLASDSTLASDAKINLVLLQAAFDDNDLEVGEIYQSVASIPGLRVLISLSKSDSALGTIYPLAHRLEFFKKTNRSAMGFFGPTEATAARFGGTANVVVQPGVDFSTKPAFTAKMVVADLTPLHNANPNRASGGGGHHSDIYYDEIYGLIAKFLFQKAVVASGKPD